MSARRCRCGAAVVLHENGDLRCSNGHTQPEATGDLVKAFAEMVEKHLVPLRAVLEEDVVPELRSVREEVEALREERVVSSREDIEEWVELPVMAERLKVSADWLRRNADALGGRQSKKGGRWKFHAPLTRAKFGAGGMSKSDGAPARVSRPLPSKVPLLPVKDAAA